MHLLRCSATTSLLSFNLWLYSDQMVTTIKTFTFETSSSYVSNLTSSIFTAGRTYIIFLLVVKFSMVGQFTTHHEMEL